VFIALRALAPALYALVLAVELAFTTLLTKGGRGGDIVIRRWSMRDGERMNDENV
jgi:hypothetical protein